MSLKPIKYNRALDHALLAMAHAQKGNLRSATKHIRAAVSQKDAIEAMRILELNARAATNTLHAEDEEILEVEDLGEVDLDAEDLEELVIESEDDIVDEDEFDDHEIEAAVRALRSARSSRQRRARTRR